jgi:hypothetical protein
MVLGELAPCNVWFYTYRYTHPIRDTQCEPCTKHVIDFSPQNILTEIEDEICLKDIEEQEPESPSIPNISHGVPVYQSRKPMLELSGVPILTDFGQMRLAEPDNRDWWMSDLYRAPELLLKLPWGFPVDVCSVGVMVSKLCE